MNTGVFPSICVFDFFPQMEGQSGARTHLWGQPGGSRLVSCTWAAAAAWVSAGQFPSWPAGEYPGARGRARVSGICELDTCGARVHRICRVSMMAVLTHAWFLQRGKMLGCLQTALWEAWWTSCAAIATASVRGSLCAQRPGALGKLVKLVLAHSLSGRGESFPARHPLLELGIADVGMGDIGRLKRLFLAMVGHSWVFCC